jgi:rhodanese-related sulfurtransferase
MEQIGLPAARFSRMFASIAACAMLSVAICGVLGGCSPNITQDSVEDMPLARVRKHMEENARSKHKEVIVLIDARAPKAFAAGHIPDARNMSLADFPDRSDRRGERDRRIERFEYKVVYGENQGSATAQALVKRLLGLGYKDVYMFMGGMEQWRGMNLPVVGDEAKQDAAPGQ